VFSISVLLLFLLASVVFAVDCVPYSLSVPGQYGGSVILNCSICPYDTYATADCSASYEHFSNTPGVVFNGSIGINAQIYSDEADFTFDGGPLYLNYQGSVYEIYFNDLYFEMDEEGEVTYVNGGITINGNYIPINDPAVFYLIF